MARPRKPTAVLALTNVHPERLAARANEPPCTDPLGPPPESMRPDQRLAWLEIGRLAPWLRSADRLIVELCARLLAAVRAGGVTDVPTPLLARLETCLGRLGLTPSDRSKVTATPATPAGNPFTARGQRG